MSLKIHLLRHGQTAFSRENAFCGAGTDADLTEAGMAMAKEFAAVRKSTPWAAVFSSPLARAIATARPLCDATGLKVELRDGLKEIHYGKWEGKTVEVVSKDFHDDHLQWTADPAWHAPTDGEPAIMIARRGMEVIEEIKQRFSDGDVLVVSHKATIRVIICALLGIDVGRFRYRIGCPVCSISTVEFGSQGPLLHKLADRSHLSDELRNLKGT